MSLGSLQRVFVGAALSLRATRREVMQFQLLRARVKETRTQFRASTLTFVGRGFTPAVGRVKIFAILVGANCVRPVVWLLLLATGDQRSPLRGHIYFRGADGEGVPAACGSYCSCRNGASRRRPLRRIGEDAKIIFFFPLGKFLRGV